MKDRGTLYSHPTMSGEMMYRLPVSMIRTLGRGLHPVGLLRDWYQKSQTQEISNLGGKAGVMKTEAGCSASGEGGEDGLPCPAIF